MNRWAYRDDEIFFGALSNALILRHVRQTQLSCGQRQRPSWGAILQALGKRPLSTNELTKILGLRSKTGAFKRTIKELMDRKSIDFTISYPNLNRFRQFYLTFPLENNLSTLSRDLGLPVDALLATASKRFSLPWSAYVRLLSVKNENARQFYETEALRAGWSVRQLDRQINSQFYERTALSKDKAAMLSNGQKSLREDHVRPEEEIKDPYVLEFLGLKDEYSETDLEEALIRHLETFLLELGGDFCFLGRQKRLRIGDEWYRVDLVFFHRRLRCLVIIDLKIGRFTHADAG